MPSGRRFPLAFGTYTRRTGTGSQVEIVWCTQTAISARAFEDSATCPSIPADLRPVLLPRRLEDPPPQPRYVVLVGPPVDGVPVRHVLGSVHLIGVQLAPQFGKA